MMSSLTGLVPARFLTLTAHLVITIVILWGREENVKACLPRSYTESDYDKKDLQMIIGLSVSLGLFLLEFFGFLGGFTMFMHTQSLISTLAHTSACIALSFFVFDVWSCDDFWYIFGFCSCLPAITEVFTFIGMVMFKKGI